MSQRLGHVDGLRGLAALLVLYQHLVEHCAGLSPAGSLAQGHLRFLFDYIDLGKVGVVAFFAISGYIVPFSFKSALPRTGFVVSRAFRLYPAYWVSLLFAAVLLPLLGQAGFGSTQLAANATMLQTVLGQKNVQGVYWTLFIELVFYALCFGLFSLGRMNSARTLLAVFCALLVAAMVGAVARSAGQGGIPAALPLYLAVMCFGACVRLAALAGDAADAAREADTRRVLRVMLPLLLLMIPAVWATAYDDSSHKQTVLADISAFYVALLLFWLCVQREWFCARPLLYLGGVSYSLYLFHPLALELGAFWARGLAWPAGGVVLVVATLLLSLGMAHAVQRWVEGPAVRLGQRVVPWLAAARGRAGRVAAP